METPISLKQYMALCAAPGQLEQHASIAGCTYLLVQLTDAPPGVPANFPQCPVIGLGSYQHAGDRVDLVAEDDHHLTLLIDRIRTQPTASTTLVQVLRHNAANNLANGLLAESLAYSSLQHSSGFRAWQAGRKSHHPAQQETRQDSPLQVRRSAETLQLTLNRPRLHNAFSDAMRTALCEALQLAHADPSIRRVELRGSGPSFCAGGDLNEFGQAGDAGSAHLSRVTRHAGALLATLPAQSHAHLHGACIGAGIEIPAFADQVTADPQTRFRLPEVSMGLIPGAGGTVSLLKRIGRQRTAFMAVSGLDVDAETALRWGLIDRITSPPGQG